MTGYLNRWSLRNYTRTDKLNTPRIYTTGSRVVESADALHRALDVLLRGQDAELIKPYVVRLYEARWLDGRVKHAIGLQASERSEPLETRFNRGDVSS
jgi:hypothetical protein